MYKLLKAMLSEARVAKESQNVIVISTLIGEIDASAKNQQREPNDDDVQKTAKRFLKGVEEIHKINPSVKTKAEIELYSQFVPKMLTQDEIYDIIKILEDKSTQAVMKHMSSNFKGRFDGKVVNSVLSKFK